MREKREYEGVLGRLEARLREFKEEVELLHANLAKDFDVTPQSYRNHRDIVAWYLNRAWKRVGWPSTWLLARASPPARGRRAASAQDARELQGIGEGGVSLVMQLYERVYVRLSVPKPSETEVIDLVKQAKAELGALLEKVEELVAKIARL